MQNKFLLVMLVSFVYANAALGMEHDDLYEDTTADLHLGMKALDFEMLPMKEKLLIACRTLATEESQESSEQSAEFLNMKILLGLTTFRVAKANVDSLYGQEIVQSLDDCIAALARVKTEEQRQLARKQFDLLIAQSAKDCARVLQFTAAIEQLQAALGTTDVKAKQAILTKLVSNKDEDAIL